jgi:O-antigen ligase
MMTVVGAAFMMSIALARKGASRRIRLIAALVVIAILVVAIAANDAFSIDGFGSFLGRIDMWYAGFSVISTNPALLLTGGLTDTFMQLFPFGQLIHNLFLYLILQFGLPAAAAWTALIVVELGRARNVRHLENGLIRNIGTAVLVGLSATVFFYSQTAPLIDSVQAGLWLFFWLGICQHLAGHDQETQWCGGPERASAVPDSLRESRCLAS